MLSHPFPIERLRYLSGRYQRNIARFVRGINNRLPWRAVNVESESPVNQVEALRRQIEELQRESDQIKKSE